MTLRTGAGHVLSVQSRNLGSALDGDQAAGATTLTVQDCADFDDQAGGILSLNGTTYTYSSVDDEASTLTISPALAADASDGDAVDLLDPVNLLPQVEWVASVTVDGEDPGDPLEAIVDAGSLVRLPEGIRGVAGEAVTLQWDENGEVSVVDIPGSTASQSTVLGYQDTATASGSGAMTVALTYQPVPGSTVHVYWGGLFLDDTEWSLSSDGRTITVPDQGFKSGDVFVAKYLYTDPTKNQTTGSVALAGAYLGFDASLSGSSIVPTAGANNSVVFIIPTPNLAFGRTITLHVTGTFSDGVALASALSCDSAGYTTSTGYSLHTGDGITSPMFAQTMDIVIGPGVEQYDTAVAASELFIQVDVLRATSVDSITYSY